MAHINLQVTKIEALLLGDTDLAKGRVQLKLSDGSLLFLDLDAETGMALLSTLEHWRTQLESRAPKSKELN